MKTLGVLVASLLMFACAGPDGRKGVIEPKGGVNMQALMAATDALRTATRGDTDLTIGRCETHDYCISLEAVLSVTHDGKKCSGYTEYIGPTDNSATTFIDRAIGNTPMTIAHELLHAIGISGHTDSVDGSDSEWELLHWEAPPNQPKEFGWRTIRMYEDNFGFTPDKIRIDPLPDSLEGAGDAEAGE